MKRHSRVLIASVVTGVVDAALVHVLGRRDDLLFGAVLFGFLFLLIVTPMIAGGAPRGSADRRPAGR